MAETLGLCQCGCGEKTTISPQTTRRWGWVKGEPRRFLRGHARRVVSRKPLEERLWEKVTVGDAGACWQWRGGKTSGGYGVVTLLDRSSRGAHRVAYELLVGPIPDGLTLDHLCRNRACVNPAHLEPVTTRENTQRARKTHCKRGHPFDEENTYWTPKGRHCKACQIALQRVRRAAIRDAA